MSITDSVSNVVSRIQGDLTSQAEGLLSELEGARGELEGIMGELDGQWQALSSRAEAVIGRAGEAEGKIREIGAQLVARAEQSRAAVDGAIAQGTALFESAKGVVDDVTQGVLDLVPQADEVAAYVEEGFKVLEEEVKSLDEALEATRVATDEHLRNQFDALVTDVESQIESRLQEITSYVDSDFLVTAADEVAKAGQHVDEVVQTATQKLDEVRSTAESEGSDAMQQVQDLFGKQFGDLIGTAEQLANVIQQVGNAITGVSEVVGTTTQVMSSGVNMTAIGAKAAIGIVEDIVEIFSSVT